MGRNGSGKTTLLRGALGSYRPDVGAVHYDGVVMPHPHLWQLAAAGLFYLPDRGLLGRRITLGEQLHLFAERFGEADAMGVPEQLEVSHLLDSLPAQMSGGELRRAELALAIARQPRCLIADEPLTEVEPKDRALVLSALRDLAGRGCAILLTGHEVDDLLDVADELIWMVAGTTHSLGSPGEARQHHQFRREYLGPRG
jgi:ABC-type multidrug transport system ATPase subunit